MALAGFAAAWFGPHAAGVDGALAPSPAWYVTGLALDMLIVCSGFASRGHYARGIPMPVEFRDVVFGTAFAVVFDFVLLAGRDAQPTAGQLVLLLMIPLVLAGRTMARVALRRSGIGAVRTVVIGDDAAGQKIGQALGDEVLPGCHLVDVIETAELNAALASGSVRDLLASRDADFIVMSGDLGEETVAELAAMLDRAGLSFGVAMPRKLSRVLCGRTRIFVNRDATVLARQPAVLQPVSEAMKNAFDVAFAGALLLLAAPLMIAIAIAVRLDGGPVFFRHTRLGANGSSFGCMKFRSMAINSDELLAKILRTDPAAAAEWAASRKLRYDPRITRVGQFLRTTSLDELPQLINVLRGEMSIVGPRPIVQSEATHYGDDMAYYCKQKPGLTGLWQVSGRSDTSYNQRVELDVWYAKNRTFVFDMTILAMTIPAVLFRKGAV